MHSQVREPLLWVLQISPEFRQAYDPLLRMATVLGRTDAPAGRALLNELKQPEPPRPDVARVLRDLSGESP